MRKNGFTLIEMLAAVIILGLVAVITIPNINNITKKSKQQLYDTQIKSLKESTNIFITDYINILPIDNGESITIELKLLKDMDIINQDFKNPKTNDYFSDNMLLTLTNNNDTFTTTLNLQDSKSYAKDVKYKKHIVAFKGEAISNDSSTSLEENFIVLNFDGKLYDSTEYRVVILNKTTIDSTYSNIEYQINVTDDEVVTIYTLQRQENCQTGICNL